MSSHHFVKEGQEPALVILDAIPFASVENLLEWSPLIVVHESALEVVLSWGIKVDVVLAPASRVPELTVALQEQAPIRIFTLENKQDVQAILWMLMGLKQNSTYVATNNPSLFFDTSELPVEQIQISIITEMEKWSFIPSGKFAKWLSKSTQLRINSKGSVSLLNLVGEGDLVTAQEDGPVEITCSEPLWVAESIE